MGVAAWISGSVAAGAGKVAGRVDTCNSIVAWMRGTRCGMWGRMWGWDGAWDGGGKWRVVGAGGKQVAPPPTVALATPSRPHPASPGAC